MNSQLKELFGAVERYVLPLIGGGSSSGLSKEENTVLALQNVHRLNVHIGMLARSTKDDESGNLRILQTYVNNLTIALKNENVPMMKGALASARNMINAIEAS